MGTHKKDPIPDCQVREDFREELIWSGSEPGEEGRVEKRQSRWGRKAGKLQVLCSLGSDY